MWIVRIVYNECTTKSVAVLSRQVTVIPEGTGLVSNGEVIQERVTSDNRALGYEGGAISPCGPLLEESVPMLGEINEQTRVRKRGDAFTIDVWVSILSSVSSSMTLIWKLSPYFTRSKNAFYVVMSRWF